MDCIDKGGFFASVEYTYIIKSKVFKEILTSVIIVGDAPN